TCTSFQLSMIWVFNRFIYRREWSFRIYRETLSRFSCAASLACGDGADAAATSPVGSAQRPHPDLAGPHHRRTGTRCPEG
ncbi:hypothetical protein ABLN67_11455, partial [Mycobacterium tuberculosis]